MRIKIKKGNKKEKKAYNLSKLLMITLTMRVFLKTGRQTKRLTHEAKAITMSSQQIRDSVSSGWSPLSNLH